MDLSGVQPRKEVGKITSTDDGIQTREIIDVTETSDET
jgi:hypothetical protein